VYCAVVLDVFARRVVGWSIADHLRSELIVDAFDMARWRRRPAEGQTVVHSHGSQYTSWAFGDRLHTAGLLGSMGSIGDCYDNSLVEFFGSRRGTAAPVGFPTRPRRPRERRWLARTERRDANEPLRIASVET
jgi:transposase InsO family protein